MKRNESRVEIYVHAVWATASRHRWIDEADDAWLAAQLAVEGLKLGCVLLAVGNADDHVHVVFALPARQTLPALMQQLKGGSARAWNQRWANRRIRWQDGYWAASVSPRGLETVSRYVRDQRGHHANAGGSIEEWELDVSP